jgi:hypothetical protein
LAAAQSPKSEIKKYVVQCKYHTIASLSYRIYAPTKRDAEGIARIKFNEDLSHDRILYAVTAVEVVKNEPVLRQCNPGIILQNCHGSPRTDGCLRAAQKGPPFNEDLSTSD